MPELPEVQTVVDTLRPSIRDARISRVAHVRRDVVRPATFDLARRLRRRVVDDVERFGKRIVLRLSGGDALYFHLGMSGRLLATRRPTDVQPHTHLIVEFGPSLELRFVDPRRFGGVFWIGRGDPTASLGVDALTVRFRTLGRLLSRTRRTVKDALLDQRVLAGVGNIYADESLHAAKIHPRRRACDLEENEMRRLAEAIRRTLHRAIVAGGSTLRDFQDANGAGGGYQHRHKVYGREHQPCRRCGATIERLILHGRSTHFCPACQTESHELHE